MCLVKVCASGGKTLISRINLCTSATCRGLRPCLLWHLPSVSASAAADAKTAVKHHRSKRILPPGRICNLHPHLPLVGDILYVTTQKTNDRLPINLNSFAKEILAKYENTVFPGGLALPVITNQKMNYYLKDLCELCGFNEPISKTCYRAGQKVEETFPKYELIGTHAGRRAFICFALSNGIPPQVVMKWTGHSDYKAMKPYIDIAEKTKAEAMNVFEMGLKK